MRVLSDRRFLFVVGKGGVGKTSVAAALAVAAAGAGKRTLLAMCNAKERVSALLEVPPIGHERVSILQNLDAVNMTPEAALREYGMLVLKVRTLYRAIFENRVVSAFLRGAPGMDAWAMLGKAYYHATHEGPGGVPDYDLVILDAPATGHGLEMLRVPRVLMEIAPPGLLRREAEQAWSLFSDPVRSGVVMVTLAEEMPVHETIELHGALTTELGLPIAGLVINGVLPRLFDAAEREIVARLASSLETGSPLRSLAEASRARAAHERIQEAAIDRLARDLPGVRSMSLPHIFTPELGRDAIRTLAASLK